MEIKIAKENNNADALLTVSINFSDIQENVNKNLHQAKHKLNLPGFRPGKIPTEIAKKYLWESIIQQELEKTLETSIDEYFKANDIEYIKPLLPVPQEKEIDLKSFQEIDFKYNIGLIEPLNFEPADILKSLILYSVKVGKKEIDEEIDNLLHTYGEHTHPELIEDDQHLNLTLSFSELNPKKEILEGGFTQTVRKSLADLPVAIRTSLIGKKMNEETDINFGKTFKDKKTITDFFNIEKLIAADLGDDFRIKVVGIHKEVPAELNSELFDKASNGQSKNEEEFKTYLDDMLKKTYQNQAENYLSDQIVETLIDKSDITMPVRFLELLFNEEYKEKMKELDSEQLKTEKTEFDKRIKWAIIAEYLSKKFDIELTEKEVIEEAYIYMYSYFYQYGIQNTPDEQMIKYVTEYLKNQDNLNFTQRRVVVNKILAKLKTDITFDKKDITTEKFKKLRQEK